MAKFSKLKFLLIALFIIFLAYGFYFRGKTMPRVYLGDDNLSGKTEEELSLLVAHKLGEFEDSHVTLYIESSGNKEAFKFAYEELGVKYNVEETVNLLYRQGKSPNIAKNFLFRLKAPFVKTSVMPVYYVSASVFASNLDSRLASYRAAAKDASIVYGKGLELTGEVAGRDYDREALVSQIRNQLENLSNDDIRLSIVDVAPKIKAEHAQKAFEKVKTLSTQKIVLEFNRDRWQLSGKKFLDSLMFVSGQFPSGSLSFGLGDNVVALGAISFVESPTADLEISIDPQFLSNFIFDIADSVDEQTVDASLVFDGTKVIQFTPAVDGQKLDLDLTRELVLSKVSTSYVSGEAEIAIALPVVVTRAKIANEQINSLGIRELIGRGVSYFAGSIPNRIYNLSLGSQRVSGTIVAPGETFSFNRSVGEVSGSTGYKQAYVINAGRTVLDDGGGICQVSTTIFRAALESGLPIVSRTAHAYRVGYYEQNGFKPGLDATVWSPAVDFVFKNDTDNHILVQAVVDAANSRLQVDIYGTADGRRVEISDPVVSNLKPAPEPRYQDDPSLPAGTTKQVDFAAGGAASVFGRKVYQGDKVLIDESFKSNYRPWQAVYLVGTGG